MSKYLIISISYCIALSIFSSPSHAQEAAGARARAQAITSWEGISAIPGAAIQELLSPFQKQDPNQNNSNMLGDNTVAYLEILYGSSAFLINLGKETNIAGHSFKLVQRGFGIFLLIDGIARAVITNCDREPTLSPLVTYSLSKAGIIEAPSHFQTANRGAIGPEISSELNGLILMGEVFMVTSLSFLDTALKASPIKKYVRIGSALLLVDTVIRLSDAFQTKNKTALLPLLDYVGSKVSAQFDYQKMGRYTEGDLKALQE